VNKENLGEALILLQKDDIGQFQVHFYRIYLRILVKISLI